MKTMRLAMMFVALAAISAESYAAMNLFDIRREARFLTDRMGYELGLNNRQYQDVYEINFDFLYQVNEVIDDVVYGYDDAIDYYYYLLDVRNEDLMYVLRSSQYRKFVNRDYFFRPIHLVGGKWSMRIYSRYSDRNYFYFSIPVGYNSYSGAHYRVHFAHSYYAGMYDHVLYHGAFRLWGSDYFHHHHDGWHSNGKKKYVHIGSRPWSNNKNYEKSRRDLKAGFVNIPSRDENKRLVKVDSEENRRTAVTSESRRTTSSDTRNVGNNSATRTDSNIRGESATSSRRTESTGNATVSSSTRQTNTTSSVRRNDSSSSTGNSTRNTGSSVSSSRGSSSSSATKSSSSVSSSRGSSSSSATKNNSSVSSSRGSSNSSATKSSSSVSSSRGSSSSSATKSSSSVSSSRGSSSSSATRSGSSSSSTRSSSSSNSSRSR